MLKVSYKYPVFILLVSCLLSCTNDVDDGEGMQNVTITIETPAQQNRGILYEGSGMDSQINEIRVLGYRYSTGTLAFNEVLSVDAAESNPLTGNIRGEIEVLTGVFDFVFIANESSDAAIATKLSNDININTLDKLKTIYFDESAFSNDKAIPMVTFIENVSVKGDNTLTTPSLSIINGVWPVEMERLAIRFAIKLKVPDNFKSGTTLSFNNVPDRVFILQKDNDMNLRTRSINIPPEEIADNLKWERIILPESWFADKATKSKGIEICLTNSGVTKKATLGKDPASGDYTIPRNLFLDIEGEALDNEVTYTANITDWSTGANLIVDPDEQRYLWLSTVNMLIPSQQATHSLTVETDNTTGWKAVASGSKEDPEISPGLPIFIIQSTGGTGTSELSYFVLENTYEYEQTAYIHVTASNLTTVITVTQKTDILPFDPYESELHPFAFGYVGAFWRSDQTGERVIRTLQAPNQEMGVQISGLWTATVVQGASWIVLDSDTSADAGIYSNNPADMSDPANDNRYKVHGSSTTVTGNCLTGGEIYFRIGLTSTNPLPSPRYGVIKITYNNNQKNALIFVRQGEQDDYLMRPQDPSNHTNADWTNPTRPLAAKWSAFNLKAANYIQEGKYVQLSFNGSVPVKYPSQGGATFQWASTDNLRYAYNSPSLRFGLPGIWKNTQVPSPWMFISNEHETCPDGYRRPVLVPTDSFYANITIADSEVHQSLWLAPTVTGLNKLNTLKGYYADGFFDRRTIGTGYSSNSSNHTSVEHSSDLAAYMGILFYNPYNNGSLFFPAAGNIFSNASGCMFEYAGVKGNYWTAGRYSGTDAWALEVYYDYVTTRNAEAHHGFSLRCVRVN